ncbi:EI24 like protein [Termitomyces sp. T112]|nr:EI24 like protein [Termitomyces sp. T112]
MAAEYQLNPRFQSFRSIDPSQHSSRHSYPTFISVQETLRLQFQWVWQGLYDAFRWNIVISTIIGDAEIRVNVYKSLLLNSLSLISIYTFDYLILPLVENQERWFHRNIGRFYQVLWLLPIVGASFYLNSSWCSIIAKRAYSLRYGARATVQPPATYTGMLKAIATSAYQGVMIFNSVIVSFALHRMPYIGRVAGLVFVCWVDAYYCFEFVWISRGLSLARRIRHHEERWAYYFAFGLPSALLCTCGKGLANAALFALVFPVYIILATVARPVPADPYNPFSLSDNSEVVRHPSPFIPIRLPIFALVMWLNDMIVRILSVGPHKRPGHTRSLSDSADIIEEGQPIRLKEKSRATGRRNRVNIGRRKLD